MALVYEKAADGEKQEDGEPRKEERAMRRNPTGSTCLFNVYISGAWCAVCHVCGGVLSEMRDGAMDGACGACA